MEHAAHAPTPPKRRRGWRILVIPLALLILLLGLTIGTLASETGLRWLLTELAPRFVPGLSIAEVRGGLPSLRLSGLRYAQAGTVASVSRVELDWSPRALLARRLDIARLAISAVAVSSPTGKDEAGGPVVLPEIALPLDIVCTDCQLTGLKLLSGESTTLIDRIALHLAGAGTRLQLRRLDFAMPGVQAQAKGELQLSGAYPLTLALDWEYQAPEAPVWSGAGTLSGSLRELQLEHVLKTPLAVDLSGTLREALDQPKVDLKTSWQHLAWPPQGPAVAELTAGELVLEGGLERYNWALTTALAAPEAPASQWQASGDGSATALNIAEARIGVLDGQVLASGRVDWAQGVRAELQLAGEALNPAPLAPDWPGRLGLELKATAEFGEHTRIAFELPTLNGTLREQPLSLATRGSWRDGRLELPTLTGRYGTASLDGELRYGSEVAARLQLSVPELSGLVPQAGGSLALNAEARGKPEALDLRLDGQASHLVYENNRIGALQLAASLAGGQRLALKLDAQGLKTGATALAGVNVKLTGTEAAHHLDLLATQQPGQALRLALDGNLSQRERWQGRIREGELELLKLGRWQLAPASLSYAPTGSALKDLCLRQAAASLCADAQATDGPNWSAKLRLDRLPLALLSAGVPALATDSTIDLRAQASSEQGQLGAQAEGTLSAGRLRYAPASGPPLDLHHQGAQLAAKLAGKQLNADLAFRLNEAEGVNAHLGLTRAGTDWGADGDRIAGQVQAKLERLDWLAALAPGVEKPAGRVRADLALAGTLGQPALSGELRLLEGQADIPAVGLAVRGLELAATGTPDGLSLHGKALSGGGKLSLDGWAQPLAEGLPLNLSLRGERFQIVNLKQAKAWLSPELAIAKVGDRLSITGELNVPEARIEPSKLPSSAVPLSEDVVLVDEAPKVVAAGGLLTEIDVQVNLGEQVHLKGFGLTAQLGGGLRLRQSGHHAATGVGELKVVKGEYEAYGQQLTIAKGRLVFIGPVANPLLDLEAVRKFEQPEKLSVGIRGRGSVRKPELALFADQAMEQRDMLSYLLIGRPLGEAQGEQGQMLSNAALNMGLTGAAGLAQSIGERMGLANTTITTKGSGAETAVVLGTWLSPSLYIDYGTAVLSSQAGVSWSLSYFFTKHWKLEATGGVETGADLKYTIERD